MRDYKTPTRLQGIWKPWMGYTIAMIGFLYATVGFFNFYFKWGLPEQFFNQYSEIFAIVIYGIPTALLTRDPYQRRRLIIMVSLVFTVWYIIPVYFPFNVNFFGLGPTDFPSIEMPGSWTYLVLFLLALLFGRRVKCGWMNTCVGLKETAGAPFRKHTIQGPDVYKYSRIKFVTAFFYLLYFIFLFTPAGTYKQVYFYWFWTIIVVVYFGGLFLSPLVGPRAWCRFFCPFLFGWANIVGFFRIKVDRNLCTDCGICEKSCDMGVPVMHLSKKNESIKTTECMGCGRCRSNCPKDAIELRDVRHFVKDLVAKKKEKSAEEIKIGEINLDEG